VTVGFGHCGTFWGRVGVVLIPATRHTGADTEQVMPTNVKHRSDFTETLAIHAALRAAMKQRLFAADDRVRKSAQKLVAALEGERTIYGRQLKMLALMHKGATIDTMRRRLRCSRRTIFRYLNHLENAGLSLSLEGQVYHVTGSLVKHLLK